MPSLPRHYWVRDRASVAELASALAGAEWIALDSESNSMFAYREQVCLLQFNVDGELWLVDPLAIAPHDDQPGAQAGARAQALAPLAGPLEDPDKLVWVHGGEYDVACLKRDFEIELAGLFDTQQAASFLGWRRTGYAAVVEEVCGVALTKEHTQYDWGQRPIDESALRYALDDVVHLPEVGAELSQRIADADLAEELALANQAVANAPPHTGGFDPQRMWKLKGATDLASDRRSVLAALYRWRDRLGKNQNMPPGRLIANAPLVALARRAPTSDAALRKTRLRGAIVRTHGAEIVTLIQAALDNPTPPPPRPQRKRRSNSESRRAQALKTWRRGEAERRELPLQVVLPARALEWLAQHGAAGLQQLDACPELGAKRSERYTDTIAELFTDADSEK